MRKHLFIPSKIDYVRGKRPKVECILCAIIARDSKVVDTCVYNNSMMTVALNLYPYNPGHLMVFPNRHIEDLAELSPGEVMEMHRLAVLSMKIVRELYHSQGFNIGYNLGEAAGASIKHLHLHIVPRFRNELGFVDIIAGSKIFVEDPAQAMIKLKEAFLKEEKEKER
jgi:ATP adenylyltransferase